MASYEATVETDFAVRADVWLSDTAGILTRSQLKTRLVSISVNGKAAKISVKVKQGDSVRVEYRDPEPMTALPENIPVSVLFENGHVGVIDKPQGMVVHPANGNRSGTLVNALLWRYGAAESEPMGGIRPGIVHRLDKDTSGVIITAKTREALAFLSDQFKERTARKTYVAILRGRLPRERGRLETRMGRDPKDRKKFGVTAEGGKSAVTEWKTVAGMGEYTLAALFPRTGRTHQLRVHMAFLGCPILGDPVYSKRDREFPDATLMLHALKLTIVLPGETGARTFAAPLPERFRKILSVLKRRYGT